MAVDWNQLAERLNGCESFVLCSHIRPDCDALGSELGLAGILKQLGKSVRIINAHPVPPSLGFIDPLNEIEVLGEGVQPGEIKADCFVVLDTSAWPQLGDMGDVLKGFAGTKVCIDHHVGEDDLGTEFFKDTEAEATGHLIAKLANHMQVNITPGMANALYAAIATDTGWFRFPSTTSETYRVIAQLVDCGAVPSEIYSSLYEQVSLARVLLRGRILGRTTLEADGQLVHTHVLDEDFNETNALRTDTEEAINMTLAIKGTQVGVIFVEQPTGGFKMSFRSRCGVDCSEIASNFGGGGHRAAAGAFLDGSYEEVSGKVLPLLRDALSACA